jgi:hypothetical protein
LAIMCEVWKDCSQSGLRCEKSEGFYLRNAPRGKLKTLHRTICAVLGHYAASCGNCLPTFRDNVSVPSSTVLTLEDSESLKSPSYMNRASNSR